MKQELTYLIKLSENPSPQNNVNRKSSFIKPSSIISKPIPLQLPRFFSSDQKVNKKSLLVERADGQHRQNMNLKKDESIVKRQAYKYSKTQKNQTPTKYQSSAIQIKMVQSKWNDILSKGSGSKKQFGKTKAPRKKSVIDQIVSLQTQHVREKNGPKHQQKIANSNNFNKIRYKISQQKMQDVQKKISSKKLLIHAVETESASQQNKVPKTTRQTKIMTQQTPINYTSQTISRLSIKNQDLFNEYLRQSTQCTSMAQVKERTASQFNKMNLKCCRLGKEQIEHLQLILELIRKTIKNTNSLDYPQAYIVSQKAKYQKIVYKCIQQKYKKHIKNQIIYSRFVFYLCAHFILLSINTKILVGIFNKILENHIIIMKIFGIDTQKNREKYYSQYKVASQQFYARNQAEPCLAVQNRGPSMGRINEMTKKMIQTIVHKNSIPQSQLFQSLLISSSKIDSFEFIGFLDKTLKWQILKMPTSPFLPVCQSKHQHYLVLDLDQTLIHFDPEEQTFHVRPYAQQFIRNLSAYYQITIFTAATKQYADEIINQIDKQGLIKHRLYRNHLTFLEGQAIKDISLLGRNLKTTLIIDNLQSNFRMQTDNGIAIKSWYGNGQDNVLEKLQLLLTKIVSQCPDDLRKGIKMYFNFIERQIMQKQTIIKVKYKI